MNQIDLSRGPFSLTVVPKPCSPTKPVIVLDSLKKAITGSPTLFELKCRDMYDNEITTGGELFKIFLTVNVEDSKTSTEVMTKIIDNRNGSYKVEFVPPLSGQYMLIVDLRGEEYSIC